MLTQFIDNLELPSSSKKTITDFGRWLSEHNFSEKIQLILSSLCELDSISLKNGLLTESVLSSFTSSCVTTILLYINTLNKEETDTYRLSFNLYCCFASDYFPSNKKETCNKVNLSNGEDSSDEKKSRWSNNELDKNKIISEQTSEYALKENTKMQEVEIIDNSSKGGAIWLIGGLELQSSISIYEQQYNTSFVYKPEGSKASSYRPCWWGQLVETKNKTVITTPTEFSLSQDEKLYLFNLCEVGNISFRTINRILKKINNENITKDSIINAIGNTPTSQEIITNFSFIDKSFLSIYSLCTIDISEAVICSLKQEFSTIQDLAKQYWKIDKLHLQCRTLERIEDFLRSIIPNFSKSNFVDPQILILNYLDNELLYTEKPVSTEYLYLQIDTNDVRISSEDFSAALGKLVKDGLIECNTLGITRIRPFFSDYINNNLDARSSEYLKLFLSGKTKTQIADSFSVSRQRIDQVLDKIITKLPFFADEARMYNLLSVYKLSPHILEKNGKEDSNLARYIQLKYSLAPTKTDIDYVVDNGLTESEIGKTVLSENKLVFLGETLIEKDFIPLFGKFCEASLTRAFHLDETTLSFFNNFLKEQKIDYDYSNFSLEQLTRKLSNSDLFIDCSSRFFYFFQGCTFSQDFLDKSSDFIANFFGIANVNCFFQNYQDICFNNGIDNEFELFAIFKELYEKENPSLDFYKNPNMRTRGLSDENFYKYLIEQHQPILEKDLIDLLVNDYGLNRNKLQINAFKNFGQYRKNNGYLTAKVKEIDYNSESVIAIESFLNHQNIIPLKKYEDEIQLKYPSQYSFFTDKYVLSKLGYRTSNSVLLKNTFNSFLDACLFLSGKLPLTISESTLLTYIPQEELFSKYSIISQNAVFLKFSSDSYLNVPKRIDRNSIVEFREKLVDSLNPQNVYTLESLMQSREYLKTLENFEDIKEMLCAMNNHLLLSILKSSLRLSFLQTNETVFGTGDSMTIKRIIKYLVNEHGSIEQSELLDKLSAVYGIDNNFWNSYYLELGLYYCSINDKIYATKDLCNQELTDYLTRMEK